MHLFTLGFFSRCRFCQTLVFACFLALSIANKPAFAESKLPVASLSGKVLQADLAPRFERRIMTLPPLPNGILLFLDLDADNVSELIAFEKGSNTPLVAKSDGKSFSEFRALPALSDACHWLKTKGADIDGDGRFDLVGIGRDRQSFCLAFSQEGKFVEQTILPKQHNAAPLPQHLAVPIGRISSPGKFQILSQEKTIENLRMWEIDLTSRTYHQLPQAPFNGKVWFREVGITRDSLFPDLLGRPNFSENNKFARCSSITHCESWFHFPPSARPLNAYFGDFNGDGRIDVLLPGNLTTGSWIGYSGSLGGLEREFLNPGIPVLEALPEASQEVHVADINGDGFSEIVVYQTAKPELELWQLSAQNPISGQELVLDGERREKSDSNGSFHFPHVTPGPHTISISTPSKAISRSLMVAPQAATTLVHILLDDNDSNEQRGDTGLALNGSKEGAAICLGYLPHRLSSYDKWGMIEDGDCPSGYAITAVEFFQDAKRLLLPFAKTITESPPIRATCCKLPYNDIITDEQAISSHSCPENYIATGLRKVDQTEHQTQLLCSKINLSKYQLGPETQGIYWGSGVDRSQQTPWTSRERLPAAFAESVGRINFEHWGIEGCLGAPWGSFLTSSALNRCSAFGFRELLYKNASTNGTIPNPHPVQIFPNCKAIKNSFDPLTVCTPP